MAPITTGTESIGSIEAPVRAADGVVSLTDIHLASDGFVHGRTWSNNGGAASAGVNGTGSRIAGMPSLMPNGTGIIAVTDAAGAIYFDWTGSAFVPRYFGQETLTLAAGIYTQTDTSGR